MDGWSLSKRAEADWESMDDCVASAANEDVVSWYSLGADCAVGACAPGA